MELPEDPNILVSILNMKLRDGDFESLDDLCDYLGYDKEEIISRLTQAGFSYIDSLRQFR